MRWRAARPHVRRLLPLIAAVVLASPAAASANTVLHVDAAHGSDTGNCQVTACKTIGYAAAQGRLVPDLITIRAAPGTYTEDVALGSADSGLTIVGAGSGTSPATSTIVTGVAGNPTFNATTSGDSSALSLAHLRIVDPVGDTAPAVVGSSTDLNLSDVTVDAKDAGAGIIDSNAAVTLTDSPVTLESTTGGSSAVVGGGNSITLLRSPVDVRGTGSGVVDGGGPVTVTSSPITLENTSGTGGAVINGGASVTLDHSAIDVRGTGSGVVNGGGPVQLSSSPVTLENPSGTGGGVINGGASVTVENSAIDIKGTGSGVINGSGAVQLSSSPVTLENLSGTGSAVINGSASITVSASAIDVKGKGGGIINGNGPVEIAHSRITLENLTGTTGAIINGNAPVSVDSSPIIQNEKAPAVINSTGVTQLSNLSVTLPNAGNSNPALVVGAFGSALSHVTVSGAWTGPAVIAAGSLAVSDSSFTSGPTASAPVLALSSGSGNDVSIARTRVRQQVATQPVIFASNVNLAIGSSELLGGIGLGFSASGGDVKTLTVVSSTIDAGTLGVRDPAPVQSVRASADNTAGSLAIVNVEGSILVEAPASARAGTNGTATVNCSQTEVPGTTQTPGPATGSINCGTGVNGNMFTPSLSAVFANPISSYRLNPAWGGVDSVPAAAIALPAPFSDSATDLLGDARVLNGTGTCAPGVRDKGAIELTGHSGVVPKPSIKAPATVFAHVRTPFTGRAPNVPAAVHVTFRWHSSDGGTGTGRVFAHKFRHAGRFRVTLTATGAASCTGSTSRQITAHGADKITKFRLSSRRFAAAASGPSIGGAGGGTFVSYRGSEPATTAFTVYRLTAGHRVKAGAFKHGDRAGAVRFHFTGRVNGHALAPGDYVLVAVPSNPAGKGSSISATFTVTS